MQLKIRILAYLFVIVASARFVDHSFINDTEKEQEQNESAILYYYVFLDQQVKNKRKIRQIETQIH